MHLETYDKKLLKKKLKKKTCNDPLVVPRLTAHTDGENRNSDVCTTLIEFVFKSNLILPFQIAGSTCDPDCNGEEELS